MQEGTGLEIRRVNYTSHNLYVLLQELFQRDLKNKPAHSLPLNHVLVLKTGNSYKQLKRTCDLPIIAAIYLRIRVLVAHLNDCKSVLNNTFPILSLTFPNPATAMVFLVFAQPIVASNIDFFTILPLASNFWTTCNMSFVTAS